jgi:hypothetical protein
MRLCSRHHVRALWVVAPASCVILSALAGCTLDWQGEWPAMDATIDQVDGMPADIVGDLATRDATRRPPDARPDSHEQDTVSGDADSRPEDAKAADTLVLGCAKHPGALFCEDFNSGRPPFSFTSTTGTMGMLIDDCGVEHGACWGEVLQNSAGRFGFTLQPAWEQERRLYVRFFIRYGDALNPYDWESFAGEHQLELPQVGSGANVQLLHKQGEVAGSGAIAVRNLFGKEVLLPRPVQSNTWHCIELMLHDTDQVDWLKVWLDTTDERSPVAVMSDRNML